MNKKGVSELITTLILVGVVLVGIGLVWFVIKPIIESGTKTIDYNARCIEIDVKPTGLVCTLGTPYTCDVDLERKTGTGDSKFDGVALVFSDTSDTSGLTQTDPIYKPITLAILGSDTIVDITATDLIFNPDKVEVAVYFNKEAGGKYVCSGTNSYTNA